MKIVMIADDLTGAADCAAGSATHGFSASVVLWEKNRGARWPESDIVSIDADTRGLSPGEAAERTAEVAELCSLGSAKVALFKKVDSTLRGNMATELAALLRVIRGRQGDQGAAIVFAPAFPAQGRTTVGGCQLVHGQPLDQTDLWKDETRAPRSEIAAHLSEAGLSSRCIHVAEVRSGSDQLRERITALSHAIDVVVCDAETDGDLRSIADASVDLDQRTIWAGSAGLASQLPLALDLEPKMVPKRKVHFAAGPTLFVVGSAASVSRDQANLLAATHDVLSLRMTASSLLDPQARSNPIADSLRLGRDVLLLFDEGAPCLDSEEPMLTDALARLIAPCAEILGGLVATGGETARAVLENLGIGQLGLLGEAEPGLPFSVAEEWMRALPVLTKAGGFGKRDTLVRCKEFLQRLERNTPRTDP